MALEQLNAYLRKLELRLRILAATRGAAIVLAAALLLTAALAWLCNQFAFASGVVLPVRILLYLAVAAAICFALVLPLLRLNRRWVARHAERRLSGFDQRLLTLAERADPADPFSELLAEDALEIAKRHEPRELAPASWLVGFVCSSAFAAGLLLWLILAAPGYWGYGASLLWAGAPRANGPLYDIAIRPGNKVIRRKTDQAVMAQLLGFSAQKVTLFAKYRSGAKWEPVPMQPERGGNGYEFLFASLSEPVDYYVAAGQVRSKQYKIDVKDLPAVTRLRTEVQYPAYLQMKKQVNDPGGDIRAVEGSGAQVSVLTDRPLERGVLVMEGGRKIPLKTGNGNWAQAVFDVAKDGSYHIAVLDEGDTVRLSDDYFIEARKDAPPTLKIVNPPKDPHVSPIEELPVSIETADDFGVKRVELHYSVNGGPEVTVPITKATGTEVKGNTLLSFEDFKVAPGDLVSFYATASDAKNTARTDMIFAQAEPFDLRFKQSQQMAGGGGGGGAGNDSSNIAQRQKDIIAATWNEVKDGATEETAAQAESKFLSDVEGKLGQQAKTLADRMRSREMAGGSAELQEFSKQMDRASEEMGSAVKDLEKRSWRPALAPEQRALQALTRAESLFRDIQVAVQRSGGGSSGGGANSAGRDLERMFDLELDPEKNQYETGQTAATSANQQQKDLDEALEKLRALARRQQEMSRPRPAEQLAQQRWEQEMLRREAEELQKQLEQLSRNQNGQQSSESSQNSQSQSQQQQSGQQSASGSQRGQQSGRQSARGGSNSPGQGQMNAAQNEQLQQALNDLKQAQDEMRNAVSRQDRGAQQRAAQSLQAAENRLREMQGQQAGDTLAGLAGQADRMLQQQKDFANRLRDAASRTGKATESERDQAMSRRFGYGGRWNRDPYDPTRRALPSARNGETDRLAEEKEQMARDLEQMQQQMQKQARSAAGDQPQLASKLRDALAGIEQQDLASHMKKNADWIRQGYGSEAWINEQSTTQSLDQLARRLQEAKSAAAKEQGRGQNTNDETARALQEVQQLRRDLAQQAAQPGRGEAQPGQQEQMNGGGSLPGGRPAIREAMQNLAALRQRLANRDGRAYYDSEYAYRFLQNLEGADPGELTKRLNREVLPSLERLEVDLKRDAKLPPDGGRVAASESTPDAYRDAVAEYFKKLSK